MSNLIQAVADHDQYQSSYGMFSGLLRDLDRDRHSSSIVKDRFEFKLTIGCVPAKSEVFSISEWDIEDEDWREMDDRERFSIVEDKLSEWKIEALEEVLEEFLKNNCDAEYS